MISFRIVGLGYCHRHFFVFFDAKIRFYRYLEQSSALFFPIRLFPLPLLCVFVLLTPFFTHIDIHSIAFRYTLSRHCRIGECHHSFDDGNTKTAMNVDKYENTSSASIPMLLDELNRNGRMKKGDLLAFSAFGAGFTSGACIIEWNK